MRLLTRRPHVSLKVLNIKKVAAESWCSEISKIPTVGGKTGKPAEKDVA